MRTDFEIFTKFEGFHGKKSFEFNNSKDFMTYFDCTYARKRRWRQLPRLVGHVALIHFVTVVAVTELVVAGTEAGLSVF